MSEKSEKGKWYVRVEVRKGQTSNKAFQMQPPSPREKGLKVDPITLVVANQQPKLEKSEEFVDQGESVKQKINRKIIKDK